MSNKINQAKWEKDCANKHHNKYDYSLVDLENRRNDGKVPIICHEKIVEKNMAYFGNYQISISLAKGVLNVG